MLIFRLGNHDCVSTINNFISSDDVDYFTVPQGLEKKAKLNPIAAPSLHQLIMQVSVCSRHKYE